MTSDSITNLEIEDVLSSIRRLVSEDVPESGDAEPDTDGRFVLTPDLRVSDDQDAVHGAAVAQPEPQSSGAVPAETLEPDLDQEHGSEAADRSASASEIQTLVWNDEPAADDSPPPAEPPSADAASAASEPAEMTLESRILELEEAVGRTREEWEPDGSEPDAGQMPKWHIYQGADDKNSEPEDSYEPEDSVEPEDETSELEANPVFFRAAAHKTDPYVLAVADRDQGDGDAAANESQPANADSEPATTAQSGADPGDEDEFLDVQAMRIMVTEIVREELRGNTGERITRNMRRMVRREIQRAIALKDVN